MWHNKPVPLSAQRPDAARGQNRQREGGVGQLVLGHLSKFSTLNLLRLRALSEFSRLNSLRAQAEVNSKVSSWELRFRAQDLGLRVWGLGLRIWGLECRV